MKAEDLKNSILKMAMEGKLVPQDLNDEPASVLLEKIHDKKEKLIKEKKIKKNTKESFIFRKNGHFYEKVGEKAKPVCIDDEIPFDVPDSWEWVRINTIREVYTGNSINKTEKETKFTGLAEGYNYIATKDVKFDNSIDYNNGVKIPKDLEKFRVAPWGSVLLCIEGGSAGRKIGILNQDVCFGNKLVCFKTFNENNDFLFYYLQSPNFKEIFKSKKTGIIGGVGIGKLRSVLMPIPPFNEQKRIIKKLQKIFPEIKEYGFYEEKLDKLNSEFPDKLKSSILQEAIQGKLVLQDPNDEPASVLLEKIREEKERLIKEKKIKRHNKESFIFKENNHFYERIGKKAEPVCIDDEIPFDVPDSWEWCRFGHIVNFSLGKTPPRKESIFWDDATVPWVSISDMVDGKIINSTKENVNNYALEKSFKGILIPKGTLLMSFKLTVGKVSILGLDAVHNEAIISIKPFVDENNCFRDYLFRTLPLISQTGDTKSAIKGKTLNSKSLNKLLIPLPSLKEQKRIINKIGDILHLIEECGDNEEKLDKLNSEFPDKIKSS